TAADDPRLLWLAMEGPVAILRQITADLPEPLRDEDFDGICAACATLHGTPEYLERMERALPAKLPSLRFQEQVFGILDAAAATPAAAAGVASAEEGA
ncbi:MAG TPA: hypothetical protein VHQ65_04090, partial [Thermoanaerobaculia bacterium]|nr:hypothetical protein [Thermoanaerobaculia bacterium]